MQTSLLISIPGEHFPIRTFSALWLYASHMKQLSKLLYTIITLMTNQDISKNSISEVRHKPIHDSESLNQAVDRAINDQNFLNTSINLLRGLNFPAFKNNITDHASNKRSRRRISIQKFRWIHTIQRSIPCSKKP